MSTQILPIQNQNVIEFMAANGEMKKGYQPGFTGKDRSLMIATYGTFGKDRMTTDDAIKFADHAIIDHLREIENLKELKRKKMIEKFSPDEKELENILELIKRNKAQQIPEIPFEEQ